MVTIVEAVADVVVAAVAVVEAMSMADSRAGETCSCPASWQHCITTTLEHGSTAAHDCMIASVQYCDTAALH